MLSTLELVYMKHHPIIVGKELRHQQQLSITRSVWCVTLQAGPLWPFRDPFAEKPCLIPPRIEMENATE